MKRVACLVTSVLVALGPIGCGDGGAVVPREAVSGTVTFDGKPLEIGQITFSPADGGDLVAGAAIKGGTYALGRANGPAAGPHVVRVYARRPTGKKFESDVEPGTLVEETREIIPDRYNLRSVLTANVQRGADNRFDFDLLPETAGPPSDPKTRTKARTAAKARSNDPG